MTKNIFKLGALIIALGLSLEVLAETPPATAGSDVFQGLQTPKMMPSAQDWARVKIPTLKKELAPLKSSPTTAAQVAAIEAKIDAWPQPELANRQAWLQEIIALEKATNDYPEEQTARDQRLFNAPYLRYDELEARLMTLQIQKERQAELFARRRVLLEEMRAARLAEYRQRLAIREEIEALQASAKPSR